MVSIKNDEGHEETEKVLTDIEKRIAKEYKQAEREVAEKLDKYMKAYERKDAKKQELLKKGLITQKEYNEWKIGQIAMGYRWEEMRQTLAEDFTHADQIARSIAGDHMPEVYAINHNYGTYIVEKGALVDTSYTLYDRQTVERLADASKNIIPVPGKKISRLIDEGKAVRWNNQQIQSVMMQSILQGESMPKIAKRLSKEVGEKNRRAAVRNARTLTTGVQNAGRVDSFKRGQKLGIELEQQWLATLDGRTRHEHRLLDGQTAPVGGKFKVEGYEIEFPGDPTAPGFLIYNCRCTLIASTKGFEKDLSDLSLRYDEKLGDMTYDEWKTAKYKEQAKAAAAKYPYSYATNTEEARGILEGMFGKGNITSGVFNIEEALLIENTNQLSKLEDKFKVFEKMDFVCMGSDGMGAIGAFERWNGKRGSLILDEKEYRTYKKRYEDEASAHIKWEQWKGKTWHMPCRTEDYVIYSATHEYGHALEWLVLNNRKPGIGNTDRVVMPEYDKIKKEIVSIAKENNKKFTLKESLSKYGGRDSAEFFAEAFANSQLSSPNELGLAMQEWLRREGF